MRFFIHKYKYQGGKQTWYKTDDEKTKKVLDIFFDVEGDEPTNIEEVE